MTMGEIADTIRMFLACAVLVCAAAGGVVLAGYALSCGARLLVGFVKKLAALPLVGALLIGGMVVVGTDGVGSKAALGFEDCYLVKALDENNPSAGNMSLPADMLSAMCFRSRPNDWGAETGYGFYSSADSITAVYGRLLMCGRTFGEGLTAIDIPDGAVWSVTGNAFGATGIGFVPVGASNVFPDNEQVYTK